MSAKDDVTDIINTHLGGVELTDEMQKQMGESLTSAAWILAWRKNDKRVYYDCCGRTLRDGEIDDEGGAERLHLHHRDNSICPFCGASAYVLNVHHTGMHDITEAYHVFYRHSEADPNTIIVQGFWCGREWCDVKDEAYGPERLETRTILCHVVALPFGGKPVRYVNEILRSSGYFNAWWGGCGDCWRKRDRVTGGDRQYEIDRQAPYLVHRPMLASAAQGTLWQKPLAWLSDLRGAYLSAYLGTDLVDAMATVARHPQMEYMIGTGLEIVAREAIGHSAMTRYCNWRAKKPTSMLPLDTNELSRARRMQPGEIPNGLAFALKRLARDYKQTLKLEGAVEIAKLADEHPGNAYKLEDALKQYGQRWGVARVARYAIKHNAHMWLDYMGELTRLGEAEDEARVFPRELEAAHAETGSRLKARASQEQADKIAAQLPKLRKKYAFSACGLTMAPFESPQELIYEGLRQHICIGSYVNSYADGRTILLKLRRDNAPDVPFHAVEFSKDGKLVQCRGERNMTFEEDETAIRAFWEAYGARKKRKIDLHIQIKHREAIAI